MEINSRHGSSAPILREQRQQLGARGTHGGRQGTPQVPQSCLGLEVEKLRTNPGVAAPPELWRPGLHSARAMSGPPGRGVGPAGTLLSSPPVQALPWTLGCRLAADSVHHTNLATACTASVEHLHFLVPGIVHKSEW